MWSPLGHKIGQFPVLCGHLKAELKYTVQLSVILEIIPPTRAGYEDGFSLSANISATTKPVKLFYFLGSEIVNAKHLF